MNTLSWLIYAAEVSDRVSNLCGFLAFMWFFVGGFGTAFLFALWLDDDGPIERAIGPILALVFFVLVEVFFLAAAVGLPSKSTIYMIAASEAGETIVMSPDAIEMMDDLKAIIKKRLKEELGN